MKRIDSPRATIIIPTYDRAWCLARAIRSALAQSFRDHEIIVVDDGSEDETREIVVSIQDERVLYHRQPANLGEFAALEEGLRRAGGEFVTILCDDDELAPEFLSRRVAALSEHPDAHVVFSQYEVRRDDDDALLKVVNGDLQEPLVLIGDDLLEAALSRRWHWGASLYRRSALLEVWGLLDPNEVGFDLPLNVNIAVGSEAKGLFLPSVDFVYRRHAAQNKQRLRHVVMPQTAAALQRITASLPPERASAKRLIRRELANWHTVWGRYLAAEGDIVAARVQFRRAIRTDPRLLWSWNQLIRSMVMPRSDSFAAGARQ